MSTKPFAVSIPEFRRLAGDIGKTYAYQLLASNQVEAVRLGRRTLVTVASIEALIQRNTIKRDS